MIDAQIGRFFNLREFAVSKDHPELAAEPPLQAIIKLVRVASILDRLREAYGPVRILSGYRSAELNKAIGGETGSDHMKGLAADCAFKEGTDLEKVTKTAYACGARQAIWYPDRKFVHVAAPDFGDTRERGLLVSRNGKYSALS